MHEEDQVYQYIKGLKPSIASLVALQQPNNLLDVQGLADIADTIQYQQRPCQNFGNQGNEQPHNCPTY